MSEEIHGGVICISGDAWRKMFKDVLTEESPDTQGALYERGVYAEVHKRLLLPESYIVRGIFYKWMYRQWNIVVEGADLPRVVEGMEFPQVTPIYQRNADGSAQLVRIDTLFPEEAARKRIDDLRAEINRIETWLIDKENA